MYVPTPQSTHSEVAIEEENRPVGQSVHAEDASAPLAAENFPVEHSLQLREEGESEYSPGEQSVHADASSPVAALVRCFPELQPMQVLLEAPLY